MEESPTRYKKTMDNNEIQKLLDWIQARSYLQELLDGHLPEVIGRAIKAIDVGVITKEQLREVASEIQNECIGDIFHIYDCSKKTADKTTGVLLYPIELSPGEAETVNLSTAPVTTVEELHKFIVALAEFIERELSTPIKMSVKLDVEDTGYIKEILQRTISVVGTINRLKALTDREL